MAEANPAIGKNVRTGDFNTNYLEAGEDKGGTPVILMHGSGPGVTAYANWRGIILARWRRNSRVSAGELPYSAKVCR